MRPTEVVSEADRLLLPGTPALGEGHMDAIPKPHPSRDVPEP
jgi:hypothetical protein